MAKPKTIGRQVCLMSVRFGNPKCSAHLYSYGVGEAMCHVTDANIDVISFEHCAIHCMALPYL